MEVTIKERISQYAQEKGISVRAFDLVRARTSIGGCSACAIYALTWILADERLVVRVRKSFSIFLLIYIYIIIIIIIIIRGCFGVVLGLFWGCFGVVLFAFLLPLGAPPLLPYNYIACGRSNERPYWLSEERVWIGGWMRVGERLVRNGGFGVVVSKMEIGERKKAGGMVEFGA